MLEESAGGLSVINDEKRTGMPRSMFTTIVALVGLGEMDREDMCKYVQPI